MQDSYGEGLAIRSDSESWTATVRDTVKRFTVKVDLDGSVYPCPVAFARRESQAAKGRHFPAATPCPAETC
jgi:hypothetical protein